MQLNPYQRPLHSTPHTTYRVSDGPLPSSSSEVGTISQSVGQVIQDYNNKIHNSLEDWYKLSIELSDLTNSLKPLIIMSKFLQEAKASSNNVTLIPPQSEDFLKVAAALGPKFTDNVQISLGLNLGHTGSGYKNISITDAINIIKNTPNIIGIEVIITPQQATDAENLLNIKGYDIGSLSGISQTIASLKNKQTRDLFKVMSFSNAKKSNEKSLSSIFQILKSITSTALSNIQ